MLRHTLATLAYRAAQVLRDVPPDFPTFRASANTRPPTLIVAHLGDLMAWGVSLCDGASIWKPSGGDDWNVEVERFFEGMQRLDARLGSPVSEQAEAKLVAGPLADALTHVGQLDEAIDVAAHAVRNVELLRGSRRITSDLRQTVDLLG